MNTARPGLLELVGVRKSYGDNVVLHDLSLSVDEHHCVALIGASGSGKSTLLRCVNLLEIVDDGVITLEGRDITDPVVSDLHADEVRARIGMVFQSFNLFPHLSVLDNITLAPRRVHGVAKAEAVRDALAMLKRVGLADKATARPDDVRRPAAAGGDCASSGEQAGADAVRRSDQRAGSGAGR